MIESPEMIPSCINAIKKSKRNFVKCMEKGIHGTKECFSIAKLKKKLMLTKRSINSIASFQREEEENDYDKHYSHYPILNKKILFIQV